MLVTLASRMMDRRSTFRSWVARAAIAVLVLGAGLAAQTGVAYAAGKVSPAPASSGVTEGQSYDVDFTLNAPIIVPMGSPDPDVTLSFTPADPSRLSFSPSTIEWDPTQWFETRTLQVTAVHDGVYDASNTDVVQVTATSGSVYYNGYNTSFTVMITDIDPAPTTTTTAPPTTTTVAPTSTSTLPISTTTAAPPSAGDPTSTTAGTTTSTTRPSASTTGATTTTTAIGGAAGSRRTAGDGTAGREHAHWSRHDVRGRSAAAPTEALALSSVASRAGTYRSSDLADVHAGGLMRRTRVVSCGLLGRKREADFGADRRQYDNQPPAGPRCVSGIDTLERLRRLSDD